MKKGIPFLAFPLIASLTVLSACGLLGSDSDQTEGLPKITGPKIVFSAHDSNEINQIYVMKVDGSHIWQLTHEGKGKGPAGATEPAWSPDGQKIVYCSFQNSKSVTYPGLKVMNTDGSNKHWLLKFKRPDGSDASPLWGNRPRWSPDGTKIAFDWCVNCERGGVNSEIFYVDIAGKTDSLHVHRVTNSPYEETSPAWSPDGSRIAYSSEEKGESDIQITNIKGNNKIRITETGNAGRQLWYNKNNLIYWSNNNLYHLSLKTMKSLPISVSLNENIGFRPLSVSDNGKLILLLVFNYEHSNTKRSLQVLYLQDNDNKLTRVYTQIGLNSADWHLKNK